MAVPTQAEEFTQLIEHLRKAQERAAMLMHLARAQGSARDNAIADGWFSVSEMLKLTVTQVTMLATGKLRLHQ